jgi:flavin reductase (DIM6/NTAB) family NADH-FMN oxidoreductase RutF
MRSLIEPGPIVLVSSHWKGKSNIMTMGWHMVMDYSTIGCFIWDQNHSREMIRKSKECVINVPTHDIIRKVIAIGNSTGADIDKFAEFALTPATAVKVKAPLIKECYANFECRLVDTSLIRKYSLFVFEVVKAHAAVSPRFPRTIHYRGDGRFMVSGKEVDYARYFKPEML